ncbi:uncharacterized protein Ulp1 [Drosophila kikkawai]|uniref:Uncharacterized protein Ulp1 n=1 Tax=Drosophila kikkawai TaxID=30033 RepID=A0A6P4JQY7_DROKI|nr:uncharacterized protein LOC108085230 [Drosophila kikkawai]
MSLTPDGFGHNAYATKPNAGPHESVVLSATYSLAASAGQEEQQQQQERQLYNLNHDSYTSSHVPEYNDAEEQMQLGTVGEQLQLATVEEQLQPATEEEQLYLPAESQQLEVDYQQPEAEEPQYNTQPLLGLGLQFETYNQEQLAYLQQQFASQENFLNEQPHIPLGEPQQAAAVSESKVKLGAEDQLHQQQQFTVEEQQQKSVLGQKKIHHQKAETQSSISREKLFLDFVQLSSREHQIEDLTENYHLLNRIAIVGSKSFHILRETFNLTPDCHPELIESQILGILRLRQKLINLRPLLIDNPDPLALPILRELQLAIEGASQVCQDLGQQVARVNNSCAKSSYSMGLELLNRIRKVISGWYRSNEAQLEPEEAGSGSGPAGDQQQQQQQRDSRKRRIAEDEPPLIKYRRVDNSFPRFIPNEAAAEEPVPNNRSMAERETQRQYAKRLSIFNAPILTQQRVRNNAADIQIDLSDDDEQVPLFRPGASYRPPPPPAAASAAPLGSDSSTTMRPQMLYSDAVRLGQNGFAESRMNGHPNKPSGHGDDSLLSQEERRSEREQYLALLRNLCSDKSSLRALNNTNPPPLRVINRNAERSSTWGSILANNKAPPAGQEQQKPQPPKPISNRDFEDYAKLLNREQHKNIPPPPPLIRLGSAKSLTSHASTISISESISSSSDSCSNASDENQAAAAAPANLTNHKIASLKSSPKSDQLNTTVSRHELLQRSLENCVFFKDTFAEDHMKKIERQEKELEQRRQLATIQAEKSRAVRLEFEQHLRSNIFQMRLTHKPILVIGSIEKTQEKKEPEFVPLTEEHMKRFSELINGPPQQVLVNKFSLQIHRSDIRTLLGSSWLNDEVINFYMNLLTERSELRSDQLPRVYAMNTFFVPRLLQTGHGGVKRWTRKVDLFSKDIIPVPVHCNGVHWCMAIIHMRNKTIRYYDSMGKPNQDVLDALEMYLRLESLDKRKQPFDTSDFKIESVANVPQQSNGSDCGVFSCMFAEYITRDAPITFSQEHMDYFRKKMVLEIAEGKLWK